MRNPKGDGEQARRAARPGRDTASYGTPGGPGRRTCRRRRSPPCMHACSVRRRVLAPDADTCSGRHKAGCFISAAGAEKGAGLPGRGAGREREETSSHDDEEQEHGECTRTADTLSCSGVYSACLLYARTPYGRRVLGCETKSKATKDAGTTMPVDIKLVRRKASKASKGSARKWVRNVQRSMSWIRGARDSRM